MNHQFSLNHIHHIIAHTHTPTTMELKEKINHFIFFSVNFLAIGYYFNETGLLICEPFYSKPAYRILATCSLYFPTTMILMYCYGSSFHASRLRLVIATPSAMMQQTRSIVQSQTSTVTRPIAVTGTTILPSPTEKVLEQLQMPVQMPSL